MEAIAAGASGAFCLRPPLSSSHSMTMSQCPVLDRAIGTTAPIGSIRARAAVWCPMIATQQGQHHLRAKLRLGVFSYSSNAEAWPGVSC